MTLVILLVVASMSSGFLLGWWSARRETLDEAQARLERDLQKRRVSGRRAESLLRPRPTSRQVVIKPTSRDRSEVHNLDD